MHHSTIAWKLGASWSSGQKITVQKYMSLFIIPCILMKIEHSGPVQWHLQTLHWWGQTFNFRKVTTATPPLQFRWNLGDWCIYLLKVVLVYVIHGGNHIWIILPVSLDGFNPCEPNPCGAASCTVEDGVALCHGKSQNSDECHFYSFLSLKTTDFNIAWWCFGLSDFASRFSLYVVFLSTLHVLYCWSAFCLLISLSVIFSDTYRTDCDYIHCSRISINRLIKNLFSLPAVPSWCVLHHIFAVLCSFDFLVFILSVSVSQSLCLCGRLNVRVPVKCVSALLWCCTVSVSHVLSQLSSVYVLFLVCSASTSPPLCCMHAKPGQHMCFLASYGCSHPAGIWILIFCCN